MTIIDNDIRQAALEINESFIVQAPAGSGKTELLTQRYLKLLCAVSQPESIIAVTFTRKAASEMKQRVLESLELAKQPMPEQAHKQQTWKIAKAALNQDQHLNWRLTDSQHRLRIITIDALAAFICRQTPLLTETDIDTQISQTPEILYREAVHQVIYNAQSDPNTKQALLNCLLHVDNNMDLFESLLTNMLAKRDQWLSHIIPYYQQRTQLKALLETTLQDIVSNTVKQLNKTLSQAQRNELERMCKIARENLADDHDIHHQLNDDAELKDAPEYLSSWLAASDLLLTQKNEWRAQVTKRQGFPADQQQAKQDLKQLIADLQQSDECLAAFRGLRLCPQPYYNDSQWRMLDSLITILPLCVAQLQLVFQRNHQFDFCEINLAADRALGSEDHPTDLALYLDYKIQHILIDEFQDTSTSQYRLLEKIICEWQPNDGRTLFAVGDPMQSIYRFRQAEVGLFIRTQTFGIASLKPTPLRLQSNFRSNKTVVNWFNATFSRIFPSRADINSGAIDYHAATPTQPNNSNTKVACYRFDSDETDNASATCAIAADLINKGATNIAVLVQARSHAEAIIRQLISLKIFPSAIDINPLDETAEISDLLTLITALLDPANRIAWLALMRSPTLALPLEACWQICNDTGDNPVWFSLLHFDTQRLNQELQVPMQHFIAAINHLYANQGREPLSKWIARAWNSLGFDQLYHSTVERKHVEQAINALNDQPEAQFDLSLYKNQISKLFSAAHHNADADIQVMTIHKSKGLEFDHVIIPHCERRPVRDRPNLLLWQQHENNHGEHSLVLAPIKSPDESGDSIYQYCQNDEQQKLDYEQTRVLYVAATRAKTSLHFIADAQKAPNGSFHKLMQFVFESNSSELPLIEMHKPETQHENQPHKLLRIRTQPNVNNTSALPLTAQPDNTPLLNSETLNIDTHLPRLIGSVIHQQIHQLTQYPKRPTSRGNIVMQCRQLGIPEHHIQYATQQTERALQTMQQDPRGQWILHRHDDGYSEYSIQHLDNDQIKTVIIDRTFVDNDVRWIIDYKTATPPTSTNINDFLDEQKRQYFDQLQQYATLFSKLGRHPIQCALYFPLSSLWIEWSYEDQTLTVE